MNKCTVKFKNGLNDHKCTGERQGDWIVFRCPLCPDYERAINIKTGDMETSGANEYNHFGFYMKPGLDVGWNNN